MPQRIVFEITGPSAIGFLFSVLVGKGLKPSTTHTIIMYIPKKFPRPDSNQA